MKKLYLTVFFVFISLQAFAGNYIFLTFQNGVTGEVSGTLDNASCADLGDKDGWGIVKEDGDLSYWAYDYDDTTAEDANHVHCKSAIWTQGVWEKFTPTSSGGISELSEDATPQLGGNLDLQSYSIETVDVTELTLLNGMTAVGGTDATLITGTPGTSGNCAEWDANGDIIDAGSACGTGSGLSDIVDDTTPQLGGNLDIQTFNIEGVDATEFGYVDGVTSDIQTQLNAKEGTLTNEAGLYSALSDVSNFYQAGDTIQTNSGTSLPSTCTIGELFIDTDADIDGSLYNCVDTDLWKEVDDDGGSGSMADLVDDVTPQLGGNLDVQTFNIEGVDATEFGYVDGVTSDIQTQLNAKEGTLTNEAGLYSALSDVSNFYQAGDTVQTNSGTSLPGTCTTGELFVDTDADTDGSLYNCVATDTWKDVDDDGGSGSMADLVDDVTPQLGGNLDVQTFNIEGVDATEFGYVDGVTSDIQTQLNDKEGTLTNEAGLYSALSDVSNFYQAGDTVQTNSGTSLPGTCTTGELFVDTDADTDGSLYNCVATDTWKEVDDDGGSGSMADLVDDVTPQLGGNLDVQAFNIEGVDATEFGYVDGVTSDVQTQINAKQNTVTEGSLANDVIVEADLLVSNTASDEDIFTYNLATGGFTANDIDEIITYMSQGVLPNNSVVLADINSSDRSGSDADLITGTAGSTGTCAEWDANGDLVDSGGVCGSLEADGTVPLTSNWDVGAYTITGTRFISDITTGTSPLAVTSTTVVTNLNADTVDGESASAFEDADAAIAKTDEAETITTQWDFSNNAPTVPGETYNATNWNGDDGAATKNDIRDKIEAMGSGSGDVVGPAFATDNAIARYSTTTGKLIQGSSVLIDDSDNITGVASMTMDANANPTIVMDDNSDSDFTFDLNSSNLDFIMASTSLMDMDTTDIVPKVPINSAYAVRVTNLIDGGLEQENFTTGPNNLASSDPNVCRKLYVMSSAANADIEFDLQTSGLCNTDVARELHFINNETSDSYELIIDPNSTDVIQILGDPLVSCTAGYRIQCEDGVHVTVFGRTATTWQAVPHSPNTSACICMGS